MAMKNPPHPGDLIRTEIIEAHGLSVSKAAAILKVRRATLSDLLAGKAALSPEMALRIEKAFGPDMNHLLQMQLAYDVAKTRLPMKAAVKNLLPEIPLTLSMLVGNIVIRFGELERAIFTAMARVKCGDEGTIDEDATFLSLVGKYKKIKTLGGLAKKAKKQFSGRNFDWIDFGILKRLGDQRNAIHDALVEEPDGTLIWQASSNRPHRPVDHGELLALREAAERTIIQINEGSLKYKKTQSNKKSDPDGR